MLRPFADEHADALFARGILAGADPPNAASFAVMERLGMTDHAEHESDGKVVRYYRKDRS